MHRQVHLPGHKLFRREQLLQESVHDTNKSKAKLPEPALCTGQILLRVTWTH